MDTPLWERSRTDIGRRRFIWLAGVWMGPMIFTIFICIGVKITNLEVNTKCKLISIRKCHSPSKVSFSPSVFRNGRKYAGEIHFVHTNRQTGQLAVLGIFMESYGKMPPAHQNQNQRTRSQLNEYMSIAKRLKVETPSARYEFRLTSLLGENLQEFWRYEGSLTTPPCTEGVIWTVFKQPIILRDEQLQELRSNGLFQSYRAPQPVYGRTVYRNYLNETGSSTSDLNRCRTSSVFELTGDQSFVPNMIDCLSLSACFWPFLSFLGFILISIIGSKLFVTMQKKKAE